MATDEDLASTERELSTMIQTTNNCLSRDFNFQNGSQNKMAVCQSYLRHQMRILRRWRNGTKGFDEISVAEFRQNLLCSRLEIIKIRGNILFNSLEDIDRLLHKLGTYSDNVTSQRQNIGCEMINLQDKIQGLDISNIQYIDRYDEDAHSMENAILSLKTLIKEELNVKFKRDGIDRHTVCSQCTTIRSIEDHPMVNRVLKNAAHIRRMIDAFRQGGHIITDDKSVSGCIENDLEVLSRQLRKVQQWQQCVQSFRKEDVEDLELILSAIESHIQPQIDLHSPTIKRDSVTSYSSSSRTNSNSSETSSECSYTRPPPLSIGAPPAYEEACVTAKCKDEHMNRDDDDDCGVINERLI